MPGTWVLPPQLLAGAWVGCDDRFIRNESSGGFGGAAARPIWEAFFAKVYADKTLGIEKSARFVKPAQLDNEINSADFIPQDLEIEPTAQGLDQGIGTADDYNYIPPESTPVIDEDAQPVRKDSSKQRSRDAEAKPIGSPNDEPKKKKGFLRKIFGKKDKNG